MTAVGLDFFDDIIVPPHLMFPGSFFNVQEQCWVWPNEGQEYFYDKHEWVRVRVEQESWHDASPLSPSERQHLSTVERKSPYSITVSHHGICTKPVLIVKGINDAVRTWPHAVVVMHDHWIGHLREKPLHII